AAVGRCGRDMRFVWVNRRYAERFGLAPEQMVGRHIGEFFAPDDLAKFRPQIERVLAGEAHTYEASVAVPALGARWWHCVYAPTRDAGGAVDGWISAVTDITARRELEDALRASEGLYRALGDAAVDFIWQTGPDGACLYANRAWRDYTGLTVEEFNRLGPAALCHPDDLPAASAAWARAVATGDTFETQFRYRRRDGTYRWHLVRAAPVRDAGGAVTRWVGISTDVQRMRETEAQLAQATRDAEAASAAKDRFLAVLSHELRTPLTPVSIAVSMLEMHPDLPADVRADLAMVRRNIELETRLIDDLLDVTRIAHGKIRLSPRDVAAHDLVREVIDNCQPDARAKRVAVTADLRAPDDRLHGDPARLQQAVWNLVKNAIKFTPAGGRVTVRTANPAPGTLAVAVEDTGVGIPPDAIGRLFNAFEQVGPAGGGSDPQAGGLGLGLAIARALAEVHGGRATARSDGVGRGATFTLELPTRGEVSAAAAPDAPRPAPDPAPANAPPAGRHPQPPASDPLRVLLVDDHEDTLRIMQRLLKLLGCEVTAVNHATDALAAAAAGPFDLLVSDVGLPEVNGRELMRRVRAAHALPGIAVSGYGTDNDIRASLEAGFEAHLTKPVNFDELQAALARVGRRARA
ncbi:MAG TPA: PAS domain-containing protein, partial [Humisphaera sp.]